MHSCTDLLIWISEPGRTAVPDPDRVRTLRTGTHRGSDVDSACSDVDGACHVVIAYVTSLKNGLEAHQRANRAAAMHGKVANDTLGIQTSSLATRAVLKVAKYVLKDSNP